MQLFLGGAGVVFTGFAAFWAWRATHWAKEAAGAARESAKADNESLAETRKAAADARKDAEVAAARFDQQMAKQQELVEYTAKTAHAMDHAATAQRGTASAMRASAEALTRQGNIAEQTAKTQLRAYVYAESLVFHWSNEGELLFTVTLRNTGKTPAARVAAAGTLIMGTTTALANVEVPKGFKLGRTSMIGAGLPFDTTLIVHGSDAARVDNISKDNMMAVLGRVEYEDVFGERFETEFGFFTLSSVSGSRMADLPGHRTVFGQFQSNQKA